MAQRVKFVKNSQREKRQFHDPFVQEKVVLGKSVKDTSHPFVTYFFNHGKIVVTFDKNTSITGLKTLEDLINEGKASGWVFSLSSDAGHAVGALVSKKKLIIKYVTDIVTKEQYNIKRKVLFTVPKNFDVTKLTNSDYLNSCVSYLGNKSYSTSSSDYIIRNGQIECIAYPTNFSKALVESRHWLQQLNVPFVRKGRINHRSRDPKDHETNYKIRHFHSNTHNKFQVVFFKGRKNNRLNYQNPLHIQFLGNRVYSLS